MRRWLPIFGACLMTFSAHAVNAASDVSARFDGVYAGSAEPAPAMGRTGCGVFPVAPVTIANGFFQTAADAAQASITAGFITADGYVSAYLTRPGRPRFAMDGRLDGQIIIAGFIDTDENCYWIVRLTKMP
jgi:hypothetical protein